MKTILIFVSLFIATCFNGLHAQTQKELVADIPLYNFFYLSKYLDNDYLTVEQQNAVNAQFINMIGSDNLKYLMDSKVVEFPNLKQHLYKIQNSPPGKEEFESYLKASKWSDFKNRFLLTEQELTILDKIIKIKDGINTFEEQKNSLIAKYNKSKDSIKDNTDISNIELLQSDLLEKSKKFGINSKDISEKIAAKEKTLEKEIEIFTKSYFEYKKGKSYQKIQNINVSNFYTDKKVSETLQLTNNYVQSLQSQGTSSFKLPSEAQLIDAMALFLANRAKQEAAIWFMDQLRTRLKNPLVKDAFPQTIKLISSLEDYKVPNFGTEWRYAVSADFIMMPENIVGSEWMKVMVKESELTDIKSAIGFGSDLNRLMAENYTYRDIIQTLYLGKLEKSNTYKKGEKMQQYIDNSVTVLYLMTNELYSIDHLSNTPTYRLLNFEELNSLNKNQWNYLVELVHLKYFYNTGIISPDTLKKIKDNKQKSNVYLSKVLLSLSQFDKIRKDLEKSNGDEKKDFSKQNYNSAWKLINQIVVNLDATDFIIEKSDSLNLKKLKTSIEIYENIQSRNFRAAIQNTLALINDLNKKEKNDENIVIPIKIKGENYTYSKENKNLVLTKNRQSLFIQKTDSTTITLYKKIEADDEKKIIDSKKHEVKIENFDKFKRIWNLYKENESNLDFLGENSTISVKKYKKILEKFSINSGDLVNLMDMVYQDEVLILLEPETNNDKNNVTPEDYAIGLNNKYGDQLLKLASFFGDVLSSTNSEQLADVISSHALPPTSYKLKRKVKSSFDFNAYVGAYGGYKAPSSNSTYIKSLTGGLTAPIGITYTKSWGNSGNKTFGLSFNFLDLGNIVNHYLTSSEKYYKDVHFSEVFSPNVNLLYSIKNTPLVAFVGGSFLPMKNIIVDGNVKNNRAFDVSIIQVGLKIDIPLINLWTNQKE